MKYKLVMGPDSASPGRNVHPQPDYNGNDEMDGYATTAATESELFFFIYGVPQRLDAGDLGRPTRYCYLQSIYHTWDGGGHRSPGLPSVPSHSVCSRHGRASLSRRH